MRKTPEEIIAEAIRLRDTQDEQAMARAIIIALRENDYHILLQAYPEGMKR